MKPENNQESGQNLSGKRLAYIHHMEGLTDVERHLLSLCQGLHDEFRIYVIVFGQDTDLQKAFCLSLKNAGALASYVPVKKPYSLRMAGQLKKFFVQEKINILHSHRSASHKYGYYLKKKLSQLNWISTMHDCEFLQNDESQFLSQNKILRHSHWSIFTNKSSQEKCDIPSDLNNISTIHYGVKEPVVHERTKAQDETILYVGPLTLESGCHDLVKSFGFIKPVKPNIKLEIIGDGPEILNLKASAEAQNISENIHFISTVADLSPYFKKASAFVFPRQLSKHPLSLLQAMCHHTPIVVMGGDHLIEGLLNQHSAIFVQHMDSYQLSLAIKNLLVDENQAIKISQNAYQIYKEKFTFSDMIEKHRVLYRMI